MAEKKKFKVLVAVDGSDHSNYAVKWYVEYLHRPENEVVFLNIIPYVLPDDAAKGRAAGYGFSQEVVRDNIIEKFKSVEEGIVDIINGHKVKSKFVYVDGQPGQQLCKVAKDEHASLIVTGTRGLGVIKRTILGSVSDYVLHHAHCPVIICRKESW